MKKIYTLYKITNVINGKIYVGVHKTSNPNDGYLGSGVVIKKSIKKYGRKNFKKEILFECLSKEEIFKKEKEVVNKEFVKNPNTYNLRQGGVGGNEKYGRHGYQHSDETKLKISNSLKGTKHTKKRRENISKSLIGRTIPKEIVEKSISTRMKNGYKHSEETKTKLRKSKLGRNNPSAGKRISVDGVIYETCGTAERLLKKNPSYYRNRVKSKKYPNIFYVDGE